MNDAITNPPVRSLVTEGSQLTLRLSDLLILFKSRVTALVVLTAGAGYAMAVRHTGASLWSLRLLATLAGVGLVSAGAAALNQVFERDADAKMLRTKERPLPAGRMTVTTAVLAASAVTFAGVALLATMTNVMAAVLTMVTSATYVFVYTPLKKVGPISTFVGAFPGAMPVVLGWTAAGGPPGWEALALFALVFFWQFPHFLSIAWLYRDDYEQAGIRMLPVIDSTGRATVRQILGYGLALIPISLLPFFFDMAGLMYLIGALVLGVGYLFFGVRLALVRQPPAAASSKKEARELLQASIVYLPLLLGLLMVNGGS
jgi:protoheme IX farnesyltransferase